MIVTGTIHQGAIVPDKPLGLAEGARVELEVTGTSQQKEQKDEKNRRQGGWLKDQIRIADDFDDLPDDISKAFGISDS